MGPVRRRGDPNPGAFRSASRSGTHTRQQARSRQLRAFRVLTDLLPLDRPMLGRQMLQLGYDPKKESRDPSTPSGIGLIAADNTLQDRYHDGANQLGDLHPGAYSDYTAYATVNTPEVIRDPDRWQPLIGEEGGKSF